MAERPAQGWMGYGVDAGASARPGVPRERPLPDAAPTGGLPEPQPHPAVLSRSGIRTPTPVFGATLPPRGLAGVVRRAAYRVPEHRPARWALLLAADRVDVLERRVARGWWILPVAAVVALGYVAASRVARR
jgi:hypothetical protein